MPNFLNQLQDKAQAALDKSGIGYKLPISSHTTQAQQGYDAQGNPLTASAGADYPDGRGGGRPFIVENFTNQLRALHNQYAPQGPPDVRHLQVLITNAKGITLDYEGIGRDSKAISKDFFLWGQDQEDDIKDVTDRLAYLNFVTGTLSSNLGASLDAARVPLKKLRDAQAQLAPRRAHRTTLENQINKAQSNPNATAQLQELQGQLRQVMATDQATEREVADLRRRAVGESERLKWAAMREYSEKMCLVSQAATILLEQLPTAEPMPNSPYAGKQLTANTKAALDSALDSWRPGMTTLPSADGGYGGKDVDTRSFGESHATELSRVNSYSELQKNQEHNVGGFAQPQSHPQGAEPVNPATLNNSPAPIPIGFHSASSGYGTASHGGTQYDSPTALSHIDSTIATDGHGAGLQVQSPGAPVGPTVAEAGIPLSGGTSGPGPASGSLSRGGTVPAPGGGVGGFRGSETAEEEKSRLASVYGGTVTPQPQPQAQVPSYGAPVSYENAEDEKRRLEREDREKILRGEASGAQAQQSYGSGATGPASAEPASAGGPNQGHAGPPPSYN